MSTAEASLIGSFLALLGVVIVGYLTYKQNRVADADTAVQATRKNDLDTLRATVQEQRATMQEQRAEIERINEEREKDRGRMSRMEQALSALETEQRELRTKLTMTSHALRQAAAYIERLLDYITYHAPELDVPIVPEGLRPHITERLGPPE